MFTVKRT